MKIRKLTAFVLAVLLVLSLSACGSNRPISQSKAQKIALETAGYSASQVSDIHVHVIEEGGVPCYNVHFTTEDGDFTCNIDVLTGEVLSLGEGGH